ncbi:hypothetical protein MKX34_23920 [Paenibacillus sp. FSL R5-0636]|uniref:hypothetical protein n=1 Tax=Paenibacillus TaxID=44249 RepID=UPI00096EA652|nr:hypothetical protein [Paenibacillus odorifer]OMC96218.1 hypothetical protein BJP49_10980 [Paenibacillus odorifer]
MSDLTYGEGCVHIWLEAGKSLYHKGKHYGIDLMPEIIAIENGALEYICGSNFKQRDIILAFYEDLIPFETAFELLKVWDEDIEEEYRKELGNWPNISA